MRIGDSESSAPDQVLYKSHTYPRACGGDILSQDRILGFRSAFRYVGRLNIEIEPPVTRLIRGTFRLPMNLLLTRHY